MRKKLKNDEKIKIAYFDQRFWLGSTQTFVEICNNYCIISLYTYFKSNNFDSVLLNWFKTTAVAATTTTITSNHDKHDNYYWRNYQEERGQYMIIDEPIKSGMSRDFPFESSLRPGRMELWKEIFDYTENLGDDFTTTTAGHEEL